MRGLLFSKLYGGQVTSRMSRLMFCAGRLLTSLYHEGGSCWEHKKDEPRRRLRLWQNWKPVDGLMFYTNEIVVRLWVFISPYPIKARTTAITLVLSSVQTKLVKLCLKHKVFLERLDCLDIKYQWLTDWSYDIWNQKKNQLIHVELLELHLRCLNSFKV